MAKAKRQRIQRASVNGIRVYSRHSAECPNKKDSSYLKCNCPKWLQYQQDGKPKKESAKTRSFAQAKKAAEDKDKELRGEVAPVAKAVNVEQALKDWITFREKNGLAVVAHKRMSALLLAWTQQNKIAFMHQITTAGVISFRDSLPYKSNTSTSLRVRWGIISGFFGWCRGSKRITENPIPNNNEFPQFKIKVRKTEVVPPTGNDIAKAIATIDNVLVWDAARKNRVRLLMLLMRHTGMAIVDACTLSPEKLKGNLIRSNRKKTGERFRVRIPEWLAEQLRALPNLFYGRTPGDTHTTKMHDHYGDDFRRVFRLAGVAMTSHKFRHFFITESLSHGTAVDDVSKMVGTSPREIRRTYWHWIKEDDDRMDQVQANLWAKTGADEDVTVQ
jgi:integrase